MNQMRKFNIKRNSKAVKVTVYCLLLAAWITFDSIHVQSDTANFYSSSRADANVSLKSPAATAVSIVRSNDASLSNPCDVFDDGITYATIAQMVRRAVDLTGGLHRIINSGDTVLIKPNIVQQDSSGSGGVTDVRVVKALVYLVDEIDHGNISIIVGDGSPRPFTTFEKNSGAQKTSWKQLFDVPGYQQLKSEAQAAGIDFRLSNLNGNSDTNPWPELDSVTVPNGGQALPQGGSYFVHKDVTHASVYISVPVMKIHEEPGFTAALKNQIGIASSSRYGFSKTSGVVQDNRSHKLLHLSQAPYTWSDKEIVDLSIIARIKYVVVDAITCLETKKSPAYAVGDSSNRKIANRIVMNTIIAGEDPVAVDNVCCRLMGLNPDDTEHITLAERIGLGTNNPDSITVSGASIEQSRRRFKKAQSTSGLYGQSNRVWLLNGPHNANGVTDPMNYAFIPDEFAAAPEAEKANWSKAEYFFNDQIMLKDYYQSAIGSGDKVVSYAFAYVFAAEAQQAELWVGSDEALKVYLNGQVIYNYTGTRTLAGSDYYKDIATVFLQKGMNRLLVKAYQSTGTYNFTLNICEVESDPNYKGNRVQGLRFLTEAGALMEVENNNADQPDCFELANGYPNPFNGRITIGYRVSGTKECRIDVYNLLGERIRALYGGRTNGGSAMQTVSWDGRNESGRTVAGGVYFIAMKYDAGRSNVQKVVFLK